MLRKSNNPVQVKADAKVEVDLEAAEELLVTRADFLHALKHDVKPALGSAEDLLQVCKKDKTVQQVLVNQKCTESPWTFCQTSTWP